MPSPDLAFACQCGTVTGNIRNPSHKNGDYLVCHCSDCQNFARHLGQQERVLRDDDGTDLWQGRVASVDIFTGKDRLACLHLTEKPTLRWYAACCDTPMFNTYANAKLPYITTLLVNCEGGWQERLGVPRHLHLQDATRPTGDAKPASMAKVVARVAPRILRDWLSGDRRRTALFDPETLEPIATPRRLADESA